MYDEADYPDSKDEAGDFYPGEVDDDDDSFDSEDAEEDEPAGAPDGDFRSEKADFEFSAREYRLEGGQIGECSTAREARNSHADEQPTELLNTNHL